MDDFYTLLFTILICILPIFIVVFYNVKKQSWGDEVFMDKYGAVLEGMRLTRSAIFYPFFFVVRRAVLAIVARFCYNNIQLQLSLQLELTVLQLGYLLHFKPFEGSFAQKLEEFNEWCTMLLIGILYCLTEYVPSPEDRYVVGYFLIAIIVINLAVHLGILLKGVLSDICTKIKEKMHSKPARESLSEESEVISALAEAKFNM